MFLHEYCKLSSETYTVKYLIQISPVDFFFDSDIFKDAVNLQSDP